MQAIAAKIGSSAPQLVDVAPPTEPSEGEVLCATLQLGVCGTDREILLSQSPEVSSGADQIVLGHECLARIEQVGPGVSECSVGDLVVPAVRRPIGDAKRRVDMLPFGQYVERGIVIEDGFSLPRWLDRPEHLFRVDPDIADVAVLTEPLSVAEKGVNESLAVQQARLGEQAWQDPPPRVLVTGMGPIGFAGIIACRCREWPVTMYGRDEENTFRADLARQLGATYLPSSQADFNPSDVEANGYDLILECTGSEQVMLRSANALASCGVMVWVGASRLPVAAEQNVGLLMRNGLLRNHIHLGTVNAAPRDFRDALKHLAETQKKSPQALSALVTDRVTPADSLWHYQHRRPQGVKTVLMYD